MDRKILLLAAAFAAALTPGTVPGARADRLGGNYRGPDDLFVVREDSSKPALPAAHRNCILGDFGLDRPFRCGLEEAAREAEFRGRPLLVLFTLRDCDLCEVVTGGAFGDAEILDLAGRFVPVVVNAEKEEAFGLDHGVKTFPTLLLLDANGRELERAEGPVDPARVAAALREGLRKAGPDRPTREARDLAKAAERLARARKAKDWRTALATSRGIENAGHEGPEMEEARGARDEAALEAASRLEEARRWIREDGNSAARRILVRTAREFAGLEEAAEATRLVAALDDSRASFRGLPGRLRAAGGAHPASLDPRLAGAGLRVAPAPSVGLPSDPAAPPWEPGEVVGIDPPPAPPPPPPPEPDP